MNTEIISTADDAYLVDDSSQFFAPATADLIDGLMGQYRSMRTKVERVAAVMNGPDLEGALHYFAEHAGKQDRHLTSRTVEELFDLNGAIAHLNAAFWSKALALTDVLDAMPQKRRDEWYAQIRTPLGEKKNTCQKEWFIEPIPEFADESVRSTLKALLLQRETFFAERVDGIFQALSKTHVTNAPEGFGKRMIIAYVTDQYGIVAYSKAGVINDLRCIIAKFMGREEPKFDATSPVVRFASRERRGEWVMIDGGAMRIRCYAIGTAHLEIHPDMAWRLNGVLAKLHPLAIPSQFRERPKKRKAKDIPLIRRPLPFAVVVLLATLSEAKDPNPNRGGYRSDTWVTVKGCYDLKVGHNTTAQAKEEAFRVLESLGGAPVGPHGLRWAFDYYPLEVIKEIEASGLIPDQKAHQFYPTPRELAERVVAMADIEPGMTVLEPSAGHGGLADVIHLYTGQTFCVEVSALNTKVLESKGHNVVQADFLEWDCQRFDDANGRSVWERFDRIVMNPPFSDGRWRAHLEHAADMLRPDGRLVAILPSGARNSGVLPDGFDLKWHGPISGAFPGVSIDVVILVADRRQ